jgi:hypothetical protein
MSKALEDRMRRTWPGAGLVVLGAGRSARVSGAHRASPNLVLAGAAKARLSIGHSVNGYG